MEKKCIVWGAGDYGRRLVPMLNSEEYTIIAFCDENAGLEGKKAAGYEIVSIKKAAEMCRLDKELAIMIGIFDFEAVEEVKKTIQDKFGENIEIKTGHDVQDIYENRILRTYYQNMKFKWEVDLEKYFLMWLDNLKSENVEVEMIKKKDFELSDFFNLHNDHIILTKFIDKLMESLALNSKVFWDMLESTKLIDDEILGTK